MISFILNEAKEEEKAAHETEEQAQEDYESDMNDMKGEDDAFLETIADTEADLASKEKVRTEQRMNHDETVKDKNAIEKYLNGISPGCDFLEENMDARKDARRAEKSALTDSIGMLTDTPEYEAAEKKEEEEANAKESAED